MEKRPSNGVGKAVEQSDSFKIHEVIGQALALEFAKAYTVVQTTEVVAAK